MFRFQSVVVNLGSPFIRQSFAICHPKLSAHFSTKMGSEGKSKYDLVIYGGTGFTGQYVIEEVARVANLEKLKGSQVPITWAIAGRNKSKLLEALDSAQNFIGQTFENVGVIEADNKDPESLSVMAKQARVLINCVGPYQKYGEAVVKACVENGCNHVDISGEPQFLEKVQLLYNESAEKAGVHIVGACGYDSVPADCGVAHMMKEFPGELNSVECYVRTRGGRGTSIHTGTLESAALAVANANEIQEIRSRLYPEKLPKPKFKKEKRRILHKNSDVGVWAVPLPTDEPVVYRSQRYLNKTYNQRPIQYQGFVGLKTFPQAFAVLLGMGYFLSLCFFSWTRKLLLKYPEVMTAGVFSRKGSSREQLETLTFSSTLVGKGWSKKLQGNEKEHSTPPDTKIVMKITGPDPGYGATSLMMVACAMTILKEKSNLEGKGGVMTPGVAFRNTQIMDRLIERDMKVSVEKLE